MAKFPGATQYPVRWWGFPNVQSPRRIKPSVLMVVHQTGNSNLPSAIGEATYSNRDGSQASFTFACNRDGSLVQCLDPVTQTPWTNGDVRSPLPRAQRIINRQPGYSFNEYCFMTVENVAYLDRDPITAAQKKTLAKLLAWGHEVSGLPINRDTVLGHRDINSEGRWNCPTTGNLDAFLQDIIDQANEIAGGEDPAMIEELRARLADCNATSKKRWQRIVRMQERIAGLLSQIAEMEVAITEASDSLGTIAELRKRVRTLRGRVDTIKATVAAMAADVADD